nr:hypothetical protein [Methanococcoides alaskense]
MIKLIPGTSMRIPYHLDLLMAKAISPQMYANTNRLTNGMSSPKSTRIDVFPILHINIRFNIGIHAIH